MRYVLSLLVFFTSFLPSYAEVNIPQECWTPNSGQCCVYASMETLGRFYKIKNLYGLVDWYAPFRPDGAYTADVKSCCDALGVSYYVGENNTIKWLKDQVNNKNIPILVSCRWDKGNHAIVVVSIGEKWVKYIDPNDTCEIQTVNVDWFIWAWKHSYGPNWAVKITTNK